MTQTAVIAPRRFGEWRIIAPVCAAHFISHYYVFRISVNFCELRNRPPRANNAHL
jgi:hypothetical protein